MACASLDHKAPHPALRYSPRKREVRLLFPLSVTFSGSLPDVSEMKEEVYIDVIMDAQMKIMLVG